jgi:hypothetical protein
MDAVHAHLLSAKEPGKDMKWMQTQSGKIPMVAGNNEPLIFPGSIK